MSTTAYLHASELLTGAGIRAKDGRHPQEEDLRPTVDGALVVRANRKGPDHILWTGPTRELPRKYLKAKRINLKQKHALVPSWTDCHTHLVFAGDRSDEFAARCAGATYQEIAAKGGGIQKTVRSTRSAPEGDLLALAQARLDEVASYGVRTVEIKSGYGLSFDSEMKTLRVVQKLQKANPGMSLHPTFLGAHAFPPEMARTDYLDLLIKKMLPEVARLKLATACDVFIDDGYFSVEEGRQILLKAKGLGLAVKVHADELGCTDATVLACELGALSADHLLRISDRGIDSLARSETVGVLLPGTAYYLKAAHAPAREILRRGGRVALSTDMNPGTCMTASLPFIMNLAALYLGMSRAEIFAAVTYNAARALGQHGAHGTLEAGRTSYVTVLPFERFEECYYRVAWAPRLRAAGR